MANVTGREAMDLLIDRLPEGAAAVVEPPLRPDGVWSVDVTIGGRTEPVDWHPGRGYAMSSDPGLGYGENPDVWESDPAAAALVLGAIMASRGQDGGASPR